MFCATAMSPSIRFRHMGPIMGTSLLLWGGIWTEGSSLRLRLCKTQGWKWIIGTAGVMHVLTHKTSQKTRPGLKKNWHKGTMSSILDSVLSLRYRETLILELIIKWRAIIFLSLPGC